MRTSNLSAGRMILKGKGKGKGRPISSHVDTEREQWYSSTVSLTSALDGGGLLWPRPGSFTPDNDPVPVVE